MKHLLRSSLVLLALTLAACGGAPPGSTPVPPEPPTLPTPAAPTPTFPIDEETGRDLSELITQQARIVQPALNLVAQQTGLAAETLSVVDVEAQEWSNSALGCEQPGMGYADVIVPGFRVTIQAGAETFAVHTNEDASAVVVCDGPTGGAMENPAPPAGDLSRLPQAFSNLPQELADSLGLAPADLALVSIEEREWADSSLGCPQEGRMYMQVITPGYLIQFQTPSGETIPVHTNMDGGYLVCRK